MNIVKNLESSGVFLPPELSVNTLLQHEDNYMEGSISVILLNSRTQAKCIVLCFSIILNRFRPQVALNKTVKHKLKKFYELDCI